MSIFPIISPAVSESDSGALPLAKEAAWDYEENIPIFRQGEIVVVSGKEAVKVWIWKALHTERFRYEIYSRSYGSDVFRLIGKPYTSQLKQTEAARYIRECLMINKYITQVRNSTVSFAGSQLTISCTVDTIYGTEDITTNV